MHDVLLYKWINTTGTCMLISLLSEILTTSQNYRHLNIDILIDCGKLITLSYSAVESHHLSMIMFQ